MSCKDNKSRNKCCPPEQNGNKEEGPKLEKKLSAEEVRRLMITKRKPVQYNYTYLYSENYQTIDKLLNNCNCGFSLQLSDEQIDEDMNKFRDLTDKADIDGKENSDSKVECVENLEKRSYKRFAQRAIKG